MTPGIDWSALDGLPPLPPAPGPRRTGATRIANIPPPVLNALNAGRDETITLVEWLAIDIPTLIAVACRDAGLGAHASQLSKAAADRHQSPFMQRLKGAAAGLHSALAHSRADASTLRHLAHHPSDMVRAWLGLAHGLDQGRDLHARLHTARLFAADRSAAVRECAWDALRPHLAADLPRAFTLLASWVLDPDANIRRCAIEATRPRGVWCTHIETLKDDPSPAEPLLNAVRSDPSRYVLASAANWINDASKSQPEWAKRLCARWSKDSKTTHTTWLVTRALRTIAKEQAQKQAKPSRRAKPTPPAGAQAKTPRKQTRPRIARR
jgi:3-methyladenine DNA glycosylase AlkC